MCRHLWQTQPLIIRWGGQSKHWSIVSLSSWTQIRSGELFVLLCKHKRINKLIKPVHWVRWMIEVVFFMILVIVLMMPSVLWCCWLGGRKGIRLVKTELWGTDVVICLGWGANDLHMVQLMPLPPIISCCSKIQNGLPFWCRLTQVILEIGPLNGCSRSNSCYCSVVHVGSFEVACMYCFLRFTARGAEQTFTFCRWSQPLVTLQQWYCWLWYDVVDYDVLR